MIHEISCRHIQRLAQALRLPEVMHLSQKKGSIEGRLGLAILLNWLAFPKRQENDMEGFWRRERRLLNVYVRGHLCRGECWKCVRPFMNLYSYYFIRNDVSVHCTPAASSTTSPASSSKPGGTCSGPGT
jgi:hypothetical protein